MEINRPIIFVVVSTHYLSSNAVQSRIGEAGRLTLCKDGANNFEQLRDFMLLVKAESSRPLRQLSEGPCAGLDSFPPPPPCFPLALHPFCMGRSFSCVVGAF